MYKVKLMNAISNEGLKYFDDKYECDMDAKEEDVILVRSAPLHDYEFNANLKAIARAGAGVNNIPLDKASEKGVVVFNTPGANANAVKELVLCGLLLSCRDIIGGIKYIEENTEDDEIAAHAEKAKAKYAGFEVELMIAFLKYLSYNGSSRTSWFSWCWSHRFVSGILRFTSWTVNITRSI